MADEQVSLTSLALIVILGGLIVRYLFFSPSTSNRGRDAASDARAREAAAARIQQMFPQLDRRTILWELYRHGVNIATATERILAGRIETPPASFQPLPPPPPPPANPMFRAAEPPVYPTEADLITRYKLQDKVLGNASGPDADAEPSAAPTKTKAWSSNREERQVSFRRRRDEMILAARRNMEAKIAAEKAKAAAAGAASENRSSST
ncbi:hypothetical protein F4861DRAFT_507091 [Xylaria intraflava]|nr:hypothetical protein F4861DRAFT_507091 [Xylaria intraflava]